MSKPAQFGFFADGIPGGPQGAPGPVPMSGQAPPPFQATIPETPNQRGAYQDPSVNHVRSIEGPRSVPVRAAVVLRYAMYAMVIFACSAITNWAFTSAGTGGNLAGAFMMGSAALMIGVGAFSTWFYPQSRKEIILQTRHYVFGISVIPGTAVALLYRMSQAWFKAPAASDSIFASLTANALPLVFFSAVIIPAVIFIGQQAGRRYLERSKLDDQEAVALWTRQSDGLQR